MNIKEIINKGNLSKEDIVAMLNLKEEDSIQQLYKKAEEVREKYFGDEIHLRGIVEFSNYCRQDCHYCGIRISNDNVERFRMTTDDIVAAAGEINSAGIKTIVLQSGEDTYYSCEDIESVIIRIKDKYDMAITLSLGERNFEEYDVWRKAGADRYLLKHETANQNIYQQIHPRQKLDERIAHLKYLKSIGYQIGSGNIIGLPGQNVEDIADDIILCGELDIDMASFSPFIPADNTPFEENAKCNLTLLLKTMAAARIYLKNVHIPATTALATLDEEGREKGILAGANIVMPSFTPSPYRANYVIYKDKKCISENAQMCIPCLTIRLASVGVKPSDSKGHSLKVKTGKAV